MSRFPSTTSTRDAPSYRGERFVCGFKDPSWPRWAMLPSRGWSAVPSRMWRPLVGSWFTFHDAMGSTVRCLSGGCWISPGHRTARSHLRLKLTQGNILIAAVSCSHSVASSQRGLLSECAVCLQYLTVTCASASASASVRALRKTALVLRLSFGLCDDAGAVGQ